MRQCSIIILLYLVYTNLFAQSYWQQKVDYRINAVWNDSLEKLVATIEIDYTNNSPNTLSFIYIHCWAKAYSSAKSKLNKQLLYQDDQYLQFTRADHKGDMYLDTFYVNNEVAELVDLIDSIDIKKLILNEPLTTNKKITISTKFELKLAGSHISRLGSDGLANYFTQWYPKPAVYDSKGWHPMSYLNLGEFYSEFGNYDVTLSVPDNYVVAASGDLQTLSEIEVLDTLAKFTSTYKFPKRYKKEWSRWQPSKTYKTIRYTIDNAHDFAWCMDPELLLIKGISNTKYKNVPTYTFVKRIHLNSWMNNVPQYIDSALVFYSNHIGEYPYHSATIVDVDDISGGDMEYPSITWINFSAYPEDVIVHEVGHNWFYGALANNERDHHWLDEGLNSFYENKYFYTRFPNAKLNMYSKLLGTKKLLYRNSDYYNYARLAIENEDDSTSLSSYYLDSDNYWVQAYSKPVAGLWYLYESFPREFNLAIHNYYQLYQFKHVSPNDLHKEFQKLIGDQADWFFNSWVVNDHQIDFQLIDAKKENDEFIVRIKNQSNIDLPLFLQTYTRDYELINTYAIPYTDSTDFDDIRIPFDEKAVYIILDKNFTLPDINLKNNIVQIRNNESKEVSLQVKFLTSYDDAFRKRVYFLPSYTYNFYDAGQLGITFHNYSVLPKNTEFHITPSFGLGSFRPGLIAEINSKIYTKKDKLNRFEIKGFAQIQSVKYNADILSCFHIAPTIKYVLENEKNFVQRKFTIGLKNIIQVNQISPNQFLNSEWKALMINRLFFEVEYHKYLLTIRNRLNLEHINDFGINYTSSPISHIPAIKTYNEFNLELIYFKRKSTIKFRLFVGTFIVRPEMVTDVRFRLSGWTGNHDYGFENYYVGRNESSPFFNQQFTHADGDFKIGTFVGQTNQWMITTNIAIDLPMTPIGIFLDMGTYANAANAFPGSNAFVFVTGVYIKGPDDIFEIYFPFIASKDIANNIKLNTNNYFETIRFCFNMNKVKLIKRLRKLF